MLDPRALRVYVLTSAGLVAGRGHRDVATAALAGGATAIQLRAPELSDRDLVPVAEDLCALCDAARTLFVVNDRPGVAARVGAGVHVGQRDEPSAARRIVGAGAVVGISVEDVGQARAAVAAGADYLGVTVYPTATKPGAEPRGLAMITDVAAASGLPVVGIGGIEAANAAAVLDAGAAGVAVISAVGAAADPVASTAALRSAVDAHLAERARP